jgi:hypothetical protein
MRLLDVKTVLLTVLLIVAAAATARAQKIEVSAVGFYQIGGAVDQTTQEEGIFDVGQALGVDPSGGLALTFDYRLGARTILQLSWDQQFSSLRHFVPDPGSETRTETDISDLKVQYFLVGLVYDWSRTSTRPYIGGSIGVVRMVPDKGFKTETQPSFAVSLGCRQWLNRVVALELRGRAAISLMPEGSLFFEEYVHHKETFMSQFQIGLGLAFAL